MEETDQQINERVKIDGDFIRLLLRKRGIRQGHLARRLKISNPALTYYLSGKTSVDRATVAAIGHILKIDPKQLILLRSESADV